jgi:folate-dependent phosphoribosylglycinamide formyltransferase PurN
MNPEWSFREIMRSPVAVILLSVLLSVNGVFLRAYVVERADNKEKDKQLILCKEEAALVIERLKNDQIATIYRLQARQDSTEAGLDKTINQVSKIKRKIK